MFRINLFLFFTAVILVAIGIIMVFSSSGIYAEEKWEDSLYFLKKQFFWMALGFIALFLTFQSDYGIFKSWSKIGVLISLILLILVLFPQFSRVAGGARRWLSFKGLSFQPGEMAKLAIVLYLADFCSRKGKFLRKLSFSTFVPFILAGIFFLLLLKQPDFGTGLVIILTSGAILFLAGMRPKYITVSLLVILPLILILIFSVGYRRERFLAFLEPDKDATGINYQTRQSLIALGSGGLKGVGLGKSLQKLFYLPGAQTDFIFSIIGEETGFIGASFILLLYLGLIFSIFRIGVHAPDNFGYFLSLGIGVLLMLQVVINLGVVMGLLPTKGTPLPFISQGGSALFFNLLGLGMILSVGRQAH